jgi:hypothetical protein
MAFAHLEKSHAFSPGAVLWLATDPGSSPAAALLDWRLNYLMARAQGHVAVAISPGLAQVAKQWEYEPPSVAPVAGAPLLIESERFLPCHATAMVPWAGNIVQWASAARRVWADFGWPIARVFLPAGIATAGFEAAWLRAGTESAAGAGERAEGVERPEPSEPLQVVSAADYFER